MKHQPSVCRSGHARIEDGEVNIDDGMQSGNDVILEQLGMLTSPAYLDLGITPPIILGEH